MVRIHKTAMTLVLLLSSYLLHGQSVAITIPSNPPPKLSEWKTGSAPLMITINGTSTLSESRVLAFIRDSNGEIVCGTNNLSMAQPTNIKAGAPRIWAGPQALSLLDEECVLPSGSYELCVQVFGIKGRESGVPEIEQCSPFEIRDLECSPPNNITPQEGQTFSSLDIIKPITFSWSPFIMQGTRQITYNLLLWEVEEGQAPYEALYNNYPLIDEKTQGRTNYIVPSNIFEKRNATYVWRVTVVNDEGAFLCDNVQSEPTIFKVEFTDAQLIVEDDDNETRSAKDDCCANDIIDNGNNITVSSSNVANIVQVFNITPNNIRKVSVEIISITENKTGNNCDECSDNENRIYNFISHNTTSWNNDPAMNASPINGSSYYPSKFIEWNYLKQGDVKFDLKIALPEKQSGCSRDITICLRYKFLDEECNVCEEIVCYETKN